MCLYFSRLLERRLSRSFLFLLSPFVLGKGGLGLASGDSFGVAEPSTEASRHSNLGSLEADPKTGSWGQSGRSGKDGEKRDQEGMVKSRVTGRFLLGAPGAPSHVDICF